MLKVMKMLKQGPSKGGNATYMARVSQWGRPSEILTGSQRDLCKAQGNHWARIRRCKSMACVGQPWEDLKNCRCMRCLLSLPWIWRRWPNWTWRSPV